MSFFIRQMLILVQVIGIQPKRCQIKLSAPYIKRSDLLGGLYAQGKPHPSKQENIRTEN